MIKNGILERLRELLSHEFIMVRKEACWIISNITVGSELYLKVEVCSMLFSACSLYLVSLKIPRQLLKMLTIRAFFK